MTRRLLAYFLLDTSGSMNGEPIQALNNGFNGLISMLRTDPQAMESLHLSVITFDREVKNIIPLTALANFYPMEITCPDSGPTHTGAALEMVAELVQKDVVKGSADEKGDWQPLLFIFTDGKPSDIQKYRQMIPVLRGLEFGGIVGCAAGPKADEQFLKELTDHVVKLDTTDAITLSSFFKWVSSSITQGGHSQNTADHVTLPPPPSELTIII
ncbi:VWA domain-containing protein [Chryseobacterium sp. G0162]|uniref:vWA domain-containing protein n=1 Tax=unclassified Chryseobacterium TaxID=2593645 RepID=UPI000F50383C|nr:MULTISPECIES: VWA domain-containing protein [unclassified Chryseobacterium]AZB10210.1 VWA domain-containing protein [Chryseobacterium sp. G0162]